MIKSMMVCLGILMALSTQAGEIVATVNDMPISNFDIQARRRLIELQQPAELKNLSKAEIKKRILDLLVEEQIKKQAALKQGFSVSEKEVQEAIAHLEKQNNLPVGGLNKKLSEQNILPETLKDQVLSDLLWLQVLQKHRLSTAEMSDEALKKRQDQIRQTLAKPAVIVSEILVADEATARTVFEGLKDSSFEDLARLYSTSKTKETGGFVGEVGPEYYGESVWKHISRLGVGQLSAPIQTDKGWLIVAVHDKKEPLTGDFVDIWEVAQMAVSSVPNDPILLLRDRLKGCASFEEQAKKFAVSGSFQRGMVSPQQLPPELTDVLKSKKVGETVGPILVASDTAMYFMKCDTKKRRVVPSLEELRDQAQMEQMALLSDKLLTGYKHSAVVIYH